MSVTSYRPVSQSPAMGKISQQKRQNHELPY